MKRNMRRNCEYITYMITSREQGEEGETDRDKEDGEKKVAEDGIKTERNVKREEEERMKELKEKNEKEDDEVDVE